MARLLRFLPIALPMIIRFVKSPRGQRLVAGAKSRLGSRTGGSRTGR